MFSIFSPNFRGISFSDPLPLNAGGAGGRRVVSTTFEVSFHGYKGRALLMAELRRDEWQDAFAVRRRCARAVIGLGLRTAKAIKAGALAPVIDRQEFAGKAQDWCDLAYSNLEMADELERRATVTLRFPSPPADSVPVMPPTAPEEAAAAIKYLADGLHIALEQPDNEHIFGRALINSSDKVRDEKQA